VLSLFSTIQARHRYLFAVLPHKLLEKVLLAITRWFRAAKAVEATVFQRSASRFAQIESNSVPAIISSVALPAAVSFRGRPELAGTHFHVFSLGHFVVTVVSSTVVSSFAVLSMFACGVIDLSAVSGLLLGVLASLFSRPAPQFNAGRSVAPRYVAFRPGCYLQHFAVYFLLPSTD